MTENGVKATGALLPNDVGTGQVLISHDWKNAVVVCSTPAEYAAVLDFDQAKVTKQCKLPKTADEALIEQWLAAVPGRGPSLELWFGGAGPSRILSMQLSSLVPCEESFADVQPSELAYIVAHGISAPGDVVPGDGTYGRMNEDGSVIRELMGSDVRFHMQIPKTFKADGGVGIIVSNSQV